MHNHSLEQVPESQYLGVTIQSNLKWDSHISSITNKSNRTLGMLRRHLWNAPQTTKQLAYFSLVRSRLDYCAPIWDPHTAQQIDIIERIQRRAARYVLANYDPYASVTAMIQQLNWQTLQQRRTNQRLTLMYKILNGLVAVSKDRYTQPYQGRGRLVNTHALQRQFSYTDVHKFSFFPRTIIDWNALPNSVVESPSLETFKTSLQHQTSV